VSVWTLTLIRRPLPFKACFTRGRLYADKRCRTSHDTDRLPWSAALATCVAAATPLWSAVRANRASRGHSRSTPPGTRPQRDIHTPSPALYDGRGQREAVGSHCSLQTADLAPDRRRGSAAVSGLTLWPCMPIAELSLRVASSAPRPGATYCVITTAQTLVAPPPHPRIRQGKFGTA
jgi:hypothetical protein